jgi:hypothetical protein
VKGSNLDGCCGCWFVPSWLSRSRLPPALQVDVVPASPDFTAVSLSLTSLVTNDSRRNKHIKSLHIYTMFGE